MKKTISSLLLVLYLFSCVAYAAPPVYAGSASCVINDDTPDLDFLDTGSAYIRYDPLDRWERPARAVGCLGPETMADGERHAMQSIEPPGWQNDTYDFVPGFNLYQRCHLIGNVLGGAEVPENLITGTQYLNIVGMLPLETLVADYIRSTGHHVLYSVWPYYEVGCFICAGVQIEARSVEDDAIRFNRFCFNVQPGVTIDYRYGLSHLADVSGQMEYTEKQDADLVGTVMSDQLTYVLNTNTRRFHLPSCSSVKDILPKNYQESTLSRDELINMGYKPCGRCHP